MFETEAGAVLCWAGLEMLCPGAGQVWAGGCSEAEQWPAFKLLQTPPRGGHEAQNTRF